MEDEVEAADPAPTEEDEGGRAEKGVGRERCFSALKPGNPMAGLASR